jgi:peptidoglycan/xylan/chitin deacetylase (PgdA/CDA1 family)
MAIKRVTFKKQVWNLWVPVDGSASADLYICDEGLRKWFEFPKDVTEFDIVLVTVDTFRDEYGIRSTGWYNFEVAHINSTESNRRLILLVNKDYEYESVSVSYGVRKFLEKLDGKGYFALRLEY